ncbi:MAG: nascent polypeptide-associated complex protein [Nanoarchaeota archaeon]
MEKMMKKLGMKQENIDAEEVIISCKHKKIIVRNPQVTKINMMGQESLQITGDLEEQEIQGFKDEDIHIVMEQTGCTREKAKEALEKEKDIAAAIIYLKS